MPNPIINKRITLSGKNYVFCSQSLALFAQFVTGGGTAVSLFDKIQMDILMRVLITLPIDSFWNFAVNGAIAGYNGRVEWLHPGSYVTTIHGSPSGISYSGISGGSNADYLDMNYNPSTNSTNFSQNSGCNGVYLRTVPNTGSFIAAGMQDNASGVVCKIYPHLTGGDTGGWCNVDENTSPFFPRYAETVWTGLIVSQTNSSTQGELYKNGISKTTAVITTGTVANLNDFSLLCNFSGSPSNFFGGIMAMRFWAGKMTAPQHLILSNAMNAYMTTYGTNVY